MEKDWGEIRQLAREYAGDNMSVRKMNCAEAVLDSLIRSGAIEAPPETIACATGFGSGSGGAGYTCGALVAAILANGMVHGRKDPPSAKSRTELKDRHYRRYNNLVGDFIKIANSGLCKEIVNAFPEAYRDDQNRPNCMRIVIETAGIAVDYIKMDAEEAAKLEYDPSVVGIRNWM